MIKEADIKSDIVHNYYKAGHAYSKLSHHIDDLATKRVLSPAAKFMFNKAKTALKNRKFDKSQKYYRLGAKIEGFGSGDTLSKISQIYDQISQPLTMAKLIIFNKFFGG